MIFNTNLSYLGVKPDEDNSEITYGFILACVNSKYREGLEGQTRRMFGRIQRKLEDKTDKIEIDESEADFLYNAVKEAKLPANISVNLMILEDELERLARPKDQEAEK